MTTSAEGPLAATVVVPTIAGRGPLLHCAVSSVLAQTVDRIEVFIIGDGVGDDDRQVIAALQAEDSRVRFFDHPKHERRGEPTRHAALSQARGEIVCYLCDRDLMLPNHVEIMREVLRKADFAHSLISAIRPNGRLEFRAGIDLASQGDRKWILEAPCAENGIPLSFAAHTLAMYRKLPHGWRTTPEDRGTDVYMWEQFLAQPECRALSGAVPTILYFPRYWREGWTVDRKLQELQAWRKRATAPDWQRRYLQFVIKSLADERLMYGRYLRRIGVALKSFADTYNEIVRVR